MEQSEIGGDPIITFYLKMSSEVDEKDAPLFSETMLRLSFKEIFGAVRPLNSNELELYRKLLLLYYSLNYSSTTDLTAIMTCFDENQVSACLQKRGKILLEWCQFYTDKLSHFAYREALKEMLYEYALRYIHLFGPITNEQIKTGIGCIQIFLGCSVTLPRQFLLTFNTLLKNKLEQPQNRNQDKFTEEDLMIEKIYLSTKHKLNYFVVKAMSEDVFTSAEEGMPASKKVKKNESYIFNTSIEVIRPIQDDRRKGSSDETETSDDSNNKFFVNDYSKEIDEMELNNKDNNKLENSEGDELQNISQQFDDDSSVIEINEQESITMEEAEIIEGDNTDDADNNEEDQHIVDYNTAIEYLEALQAYAIIHEHIDAFELLDTVDSILRKKNTEK